MRVKLNTVMCGPMGNVAIGQEADFDDAQARALIDGGYATAVQPLGSAAVLCAPKKAVLSVPETAALTGRKKRGARGHGV